MAGPVFGGVRTKHGHVETKRYPADSPHVELSYAGRMRGELTARGRGRWSLYLGQHKAGAFTSRIELSHETAIPGGWTAALDWAAPIVADFAQRPGAYR